MREATIWCMIENVERKNMNDNTNVPVFQGMPDGAQEYIPQLENNISHSFTASTQSGILLRDGTYVANPQNTFSNKPMFHKTYGMAVADMLGGDMKLGEDDHTIYVRDIDVENMKNNQLNTWHAILSIEAEYAVPARSRVPGWRKLFTIMLKHRERIHHGIRFGTHAFIPGEEHAIQVENDEAYEFTVTDTPHRSLMIQAQQWAQWLTADEHSAENLLRMFASPFLEPYKHLTYVMYGGGGNGKGIVASAIKNSYPTYASTFDTKRFADARGFSGEQEGRKVVGKYWLFDEEADVVDSNSMTQIKRLSTGDPIVARGIGENAITFTPLATLVIATNNPVISAISEASNRRMALIRMKDGRKSDDFMQLLDFIREHGASPFIAASIDLWTVDNEHWRDVSIGDESDLDDAEAWVRDEICVKGYAISSDNPFTKRFGSDKRLKLGLESTVRRLADGKTHRVLAVLDEKRFQPYRLAFERELASNDNGVEHPVVNIPAPIPAEELDSLDPEDYGFKYECNPAEPDKKSYNWEKNTEPDGRWYQSRQPAVDALQKGGAYAVVPDSGFMIIDMDQFKPDPKRKLDTDGNSGWEWLNKHVGSYGTAAFPRTYLVRTPSGGVHAYYRIPDKYIGQIKNLAQNPVDTRTGRKGYVIGAGSTTMKGQYQPVDVNKIPELSDELVAWLRENNYFEQKKHIVFSSPKTGGDPDLSPVAEGSRNVTLHDWAYGRMVHYPENEAQIHDDLLSRGRASNLSDMEIETIWRSITTQLGR